jgi:hypothetical protein
MQERTKIAREKIDSVRNRIQKQTAYHFQRDLHQARRLQSFDLSPVIGISFKASEAIAQ